MACLPRCSAAMNNNPCASEFWAIPQETRSFNGTGCRKIRPTSQSTWPRQSIYPDPHLSAHKRSGFQDMDAFPLTWLELVTGTDPKVCTFSDLVGGTAAGEEDIGASSIDPKVTAEARTEDEKIKKTGKKGRGWQTLFYGAYVISGDSDTIRLWRVYPALVLVHLDDEREWGEHLCLGLEIESVEKARLMLKRWLVMQLHLKLKICSFCKEEWEGKKRRKENVRIVAIFFCWTEWSRVGWSSKMTCQRREYQLEDGNLARRCDSNKNDTKNKLRRICKRVVHTWRWQGKTAQ